MELLWVRRAALSIANTEGVPTTEIRSRYGRGTEDEAECVKVKGTGVGATPRHDCHDFHFFSHSYFP